MEANEIICPQCGLANNELADSCVQCGIIFIKNPAVNTQTVQADQKRKAIEEAEAMLDDTPASPESDAFKNEIIRPPDPHEDTAEIQIPNEETADIESETPEAEEPKAAAPEEPKAAQPEELKLKDNENSENQEIEMEAIEATMEAVEGTADAEALFLSEVTTDKPGMTAAPQTARNTEGPSVEPDRADDKEAENPVSGADKEDSQDTKAEAQLSGPPPEGGPVNEIQKEEKNEKKTSPETPSEKADAAEKETAVAEVVESTESEGDSIPADTAQLQEREVQIDDKPESKIAEAAATAAEASPFANATIEMPEALAGSQAREDEAAEKAKQEALKKQREAQARAEALEKEKAAQAVAMKKKKLAQAQALQKQRAAQAKAEALKKKREALAKVLASKRQEAARSRADALKKQKAAQDRAEASSQEVQHASSGVAPSDGGTNHYERLLGLLKRYKGKAIGINYDNSSEIREAELVEANEEFFSVRVKDKKLQYSYPLKTILTIVEGQEGVETGEGDKKAKFDAVIKVFPLVSF
jgi:colicin import membrane protein